MTYVLKRLAKWFVPVCEIDNPVVTLDFLGVKVRFLITKTKQNKKYFIRTNLLGNINDRVED